MTNKIIAIAQSVEIVPLDEREQALYESDLAQGEARKIAESLPLTISEKLESVGLTISDLKTALGL